MARAVDGLKRQIWSQRLRRFEQVRVTVTAFCHEEGVSVPAFYYWKRILASEESAAPLAPKPPELARPRSLNRDSFVPVQLLSSAAVEICLSNGVRLTIPAGEPTALAAAAGRLPPQVATEGESC